MASLQAGDRCSDCINCRRWESDYTKGSCGLGYGEGFPIDRPAPSTCIYDGRTRAY